MPGMIILTARGSVHCRNSYASKKSARLRRAKRIPARYARRAVPIATDDFILGDRLGRYLDTEDQLRSALHQPPARSQGDRSGRSRVYAGGYYQQGR